jgi:hypothetical protein
LTCGHNIRDRAGRVIYNAQRVAVTPGKNTSREQTFADRMSWTPFGSHITTNCAPHPQWRDHFNHHYDYGLITLPNDIGSKKFGFLNNRRLGYWGSAAEGGGTVLAAIDPETIRNKVVYVCGYPNDKCGDKPYNGVTCPKGQRGGTQFSCLRQSPRPQAADGTPASLSPCRRQVRAKWRTHLETRRKSLALRWNRVQLRIHVRSVHTPQRRGADHNRATKRVEERTGVACLTPVSAHGQQRLSATCVANSSKGDSHDS